MEHNFKEGDLVFCPNYSMIIFISADPDNSIIRIAGGWAKYKVISSYEIIEDGRLNSNFCDDLLDNAFVIGNIKTLHDLCLEEYNKNV